MDPESDSSPSILSRKSRSLLAAGSGKLLAAGGGKLLAAGGGRRRLSRGKDKGDHKYLITDSTKKCIYLYTEKIAGQMDTYITKDDPSGKGGRVLVKDETINITITPNDVTGVTVSCPDLKKPKSTGILNIPLTDGGLKVDLKLVLDVYRGRYWELNSQSRIKVWGSVATKDLTIRNPEEVTAGTQFSYSCQSLALRSLKPKLNGSDAEVRLTFSRFQIQPYGSFKQNGKEKIFHESFDCSTWFTVPLWTGTLVVLLFTAILAMGVIALLDIKTMDRFENPKGKTITIAATAD